MRRRALGAVGAAVALAAVVAIDRSDVATGCAESVTKPVLRSDTVIEMVRSWADRDLPEH